MKIRKVEPTLKRILQAPGKLEESGKILEKDLWVRAHSKDTPLNDLKQRLRRLNKWLKRDNNLEIS